MTGDNFDMPLVALRGLVAFPNVNINFDLSRAKSIEAMETAMAEERLVFLVSQKNPMAEDIVADNLYNVGTVAKIKNVMSTPTGIIRVTAEGLRRAYATNITRKNPYFRVKGEYLDSQFNGDIYKKEATLNLLKEAFEKYTVMNPRFTPDFIVQIMSSDNLGYVCDAITARVNFKHDLKQQVLEKVDILTRGVLLLRLLNNENGILGIQMEINAQVKANIDQAQREYFLREQIKVINEELGDKNSATGEIKEYRKKMDSLKMPDYAKEKLEKEFERVARMAQGSAEGSVCRDYIETVLALPWGKYSKEVNSIAKAEAILNKDHYGLEDIKERILEYLAVRQKSEDNNAPILCLVGPPGVGKTSIAKSVARALNRKYVRMSLGGIKDEAEVRGHRRTYIGAIPGRIIAAMKEAGTNNPLILLDEIDKLGSDYKGDPAAAFLEVLDGEQNFAFRDNYMEIPYDISRVLFMCTANSLDTIPRPLLDRMEVLTLSSYTELEKLNIATEYLVNKQLKKCGLRKADLKIRKDAISDIIAYYTREAGVRELERTIGTICRKAVKNQLEDEKAITVTSKNIEQFLGKKKYVKEGLNKNNEVGICRGLAWTAVGGTTLIIEVNILKGTGKFAITGNVGKVMEESYKAALSYIRGNAEKLGIDVDFEKIDIHIHIPEAATPKDGPSAGITMATAMVSALTGIAVRRDVAMTGEITLRGRVMPIGGLKEKVLAARRIGVKTIIVPSENASDLEEIPEYAKTDIEFVLAERMEEVLQNALVKNVMPIQNEEAAITKVVIEDTVKSGVDTITRCEKR